MTGWEYRIVSLGSLAGSGNDASDPTRPLDQLGSAGWEAVGMSTLSDGTVAVLLKRHSSNDHEARRGRPSRLADVPVDRPTTAPIPR